ncbi:MAG: 50S ribosomal protein L39e [Candidatus Thermoplasmatota archaeon]|nr:50S ribosomal protein L39e [Candidatus Thermoplasmatota archaeon]
MSSRIPFGKKKRLIRATNSNRRVPAWVMQRTARRFTSHSKRYNWRRSRLQK